MKFFEIFEDLKGQSGHASESLDRADPDEDTEITSSLFTLTEKLDEFISLMESFPGLLAIVNERVRQKSTVNEWEEGEGFTDSNDDEQDNYELLKAANAYVVYASSQDSGVPYQVKGHLLNMPPYWPWDQKDWKPGPTAIRTLEKAGALIAAEIDRLKRKESRNAGTVEGPGAA